MSDTPSDDEETMDVRAIEEALAFLEGGDPLDRASLSPEAEAYLEVLTALPHALDPAAPPPEIRQLLLEGVDGPSRGETAGDGVPAGEDRRTVRALPSLPPPSTAIPRWMTALAAGLVAAVLGLGAVTLRLSESVELQRQEIASLTQVMMIGHLEAEAKATSYVDLSADPRLATIQISGSKLYPLTAPEGRSGSRAGSREDGAHGAVFVCSKHRRWYLRLDGLEPAPRDQTYRLWFLTGSGPVPVSDLVVLPGKPVEITADRMPPDTRGILVSRESDPPADRAPDLDHVVVEGSEILKV